MATNKHAIIRYQALDKCFSNFGRRFYIDDLIEACNLALHNLYGITDGIKRRQIFDDIIFMESEDGYCIDLERVKDGRKVYYRYKDRNFSINKQPISTTEAEQLKSTIYMLNRFKGLPQFEWMEEVMARFEDTFRLKSNIRSVVSFEQNQYLRGLEHFTPLFNAITNRQVLNIEYSPAFGNKQNFTIHPYHLKQYNSRWFLFGLNVAAQCSQIMNMAIDRISGFSILPVEYIDNVDIDFNEYFDDVVGVTIPNESTTETIRLKFDKRRLPYVVSKPLHPSQKNKDIESGIVEISVKPNNELTSLVLSFGEHVEVLSPDSLREQIKDKIEILADKYDLCE